MTNREKIYYIGNLNETPKFYSKTYLNLNNILYRKVIKKHHDKICDSLLFVFDDILERAYYVISLTYANYYYCKKD